MTAYHQMGHDTQNLLGEVSGFGGAILSPVNGAEEFVVELIGKHGSDTFEFIFDPQLYFPRRGDRGELSSWSYFPKDFETADVSSYSWWKPIIEELADTAQRVGARAVCSPALVPAMLTDEYYEAMRMHADTLVDVAGGACRVLQTVIVRVADLATENRALRIASVVSAAKAAGVYLVMLSDVRARDELREVDHLVGVMRLIRELEDADVPVLVGCASSDVVLWKAAGASGCATGKYANLRRFDPTRFSDKKDGGSQTAYWMEEQLLAFLRQSDLVRVQRHSIATDADNPFGVLIRDQIAADPKKPWVGLGWRQYMHWFADVEARLSDGRADAKTLIAEAQAKWSLLDKHNDFMEERANDGAWLRPWLRAIEIIRGVA